MISIWGVTVSQTKGELSKTLVDGPQLGLWFFLEQKTIPKKLGLRGDSVCLLSICIKVEDSSPSPRKPSNLVTHPHTGACYPMSRSVPQTYTLGNTGQTRICLPLALQFALWGIEPRPRGFHPKCLTSQSSIHWQKLLGRWVFFFVFKLCYNNFWECV